MRHLAWPTYLYSWWNEWSTQQMDHVFYANKCPTSRACTPEKTQDTTIAKSPFTRWWLKPREGASAWPSSNAIILYLGLHVNSQVVLFLFLFFWNLTPMLLLPFFWLYSIIYTCIYKIVCMYSLVILMWLGDNEMYTIMRQFILYRFGAMGIHFLFVQFVVNPGTMSYRSFCILSFNLRNFLVYHERYPRIIFILPSYLFLMVLKFS